MRLIAIFIFAMTTSRIFAGKYTALSESVSSKVNAKRPQLSPLNFSRDSNTQQRFRKYDVSAAINAMNEVPNRTKEMFVVPSKQFPLSRKQTLRPEETNTNWKRKRKQITNDLVVAVNATQKADVNLINANGKVSEDKELLQGYLPANQYEASRSKTTTHDLSGRKSMRPEMLQLVADRLKSVAAQLIAKCRRTLGEEKSLNYNKCHHKIRKVLEKILSHYEALRQDSRITVVSLLSRFKRQAKSTDTNTKEQDETAADEADATVVKRRSKREPSLGKQTEDEKLKGANITDELTHDQKHFMNLLMDNIFEDIENKTDLEEKKKEAEKKQNEWDEKLKHIKTDISKAFEVKTTIRKVSRAVNGTDEVEDSASEADESLHELNVIVIAITTTRKTIYTNYNR